MSSWDLGCFDFVFHYDFLFEKEKIMYEGGWGSGGVEVGRAAGRERILSKYFA